MCEVIGEVQNELMMAVIVASTAFAGLIGLIIWQVMQNGAVVGKRLRVCLCLSCFFGICAASLGIVWFYFGELTCFGYWAGRLAVVLVILQIWLSVELPARFMGSICR